MRRKDATRRPAAMAVASLRQRLAGVDAAVARVHLGQVESARLQLFQCRQLRLVVPRTVPAGMSSAVAGKAASAQAGVGHAGLQRATPWVGRQLRQPRRTSAPPAAPPAQTPRGSWARAAPAAWPGQTAGRRVGRVRGARRHEAQAGLWPTASGPTPPRAYAAPGPALRSHPPPPLPACTARQRTVACRRAREKRGACGARASRENMDAEMPEP